MGGVLRSVGDVVTAPFKAAGQVLKGTGELLGGVIGGAGKMLTGDFKGGLESMGNGVVGFGKGLWKGTGELVHGALSGVEGLAGIAGGVVGFGLGLPFGGPFLGGAAGAMLGMGVGNAVGGIFGQLDNGAQNLFGIGDGARPAQQAGCEMQQQNNYQNFGPGNSSFCPMPQQANQAAMQQYYMQQQQQQQTQQMMWGNDGMGCGQQLPYSFYQGAPNYPGQSQPCCCHRPPQNYGCAPGWTNYGV